MGDDIASVKRTRAGVKSKLTRFTNYVNAFEPDTGNLEELKARLENAVNLLTEFNVCQDRIRELDEEDKLARDLDAESELFEPNFYRAITKARGKIPNTGARVNNEQIVVNARTNVKIPTIALPHFDGSYEKWNHFYDLFKALVDSDSSLSRVQKFYYLNSVLKDQAAQVIHSLAITEENYEIALELLKQRFENKRLTIRYHVRALFDLPGVTKESASALRALSDELCKHLRALKNIGEPVDQWDTLICEMVLNKLDFVTKREWEQKIISENWKTIEQLKTFLANRCQVLEAIQHKKENTESGNKGQGQSGKSKTNQSTSHVSTQNSSQNNCAICQEEHKLYQCKKFNDSPVQTRVNEIKRLNLCLNCLGKGHTAKVCKAGNCRQCGKKHNTLLHFGERVESQQQTTSASKSDNDNRAGSASTSQSVQSISTYTIKKPERVLLSTAIVLVDDKFGNKIEARALLDSGSQSNFISRSMWEKLRLPTKKNHQSIGAIAQSVTQVTEMTNATIRSKLNEFSVKLAFSILNEITDKIPLVTFDSQSIKIPDYVVLADPRYHIPQGVDLLLGAGIFWDLLCAEQIREDKHKPVIQKTKLGWVVGGPYSVKTQRKSPGEFCGISTVDPLQDQLQRFWKIEEMQRAEPLSPEELECEKHFQQTHRRLATGRFEVRLPLRKNPNELGDSYGKAVKRLRSIERKFDKNPQLKSRYSLFMEEYEAMEHMSIVKGDDESPIENYLPHHAVIDEGRSTTKLRVVFDASSGTTTEKSLNDVLMVGPVIQQELTNIVIRFRQHKYVLTADIAKMYRQISVHPNDRDLQRIVWRKDSQAPPEKYRLNTLTYGTGPASFLATRCLKQLAIENDEKFPEACEIIQRDFYVDDLITGGDNIPTLRQRKAEVIDILQSAELPLRKWKSNSIDLLETQDNNNEAMPATIGEETKILGLRWCAHKDELYYKVSTDSAERRPTKRVILSFVAQLFDPLGLIGPATIKPKILLQQLWKLKAGWDEALPLDINTKWMSYLEKLAGLNEISVPRHSLCSQPTRVEMHGFCDASTKAYGACIYLKSTDPSGASTIRLLCAKSRVAPIKPVKLPRLELCGALLLSQLFKKMEASLTIKVKQKFYWCDSTVALAWIKGQPFQWMEFVRNRVTEIQETTHPSEWRYVASEHNPADIISRGIAPDQLRDSQLWWNGPEWLLNDEKAWPVSTEKAPKEIPESRNLTLSFPAITMSKDIFERYSSLKKLQSVIGYALRFVNNARARSGQGQIRTGPLDTEELQSAMNALIKVAQLQSFGEELKELENDRPVASRSRLLELHPFLDKNKILRVGGRLRHATLSYAKRHPIVLAANHPLSKMIIMYYHHRDLHAGPSLLMASVREQYWILSLRGAIRSALRKCITCFRLRPISPTQIMGDLPSERITPSRPFSCVGVDYAGPYTIKVSRNKSAKAYICLFVCMSTKAVHIEIVSDMTTVAFLNALKRFLSRRGKPKTINSDNGTNFQGANNVMKQFSELVKSRAHKEAVMNFAAENSIEWKFIPPLSPHVGGLWEAAVKSAKAHAKAVIGETILSFEELCTIFCQIEACLNSRPFSPLSSDPSEFEALTPGHFLIGSPLTALPEKDVSDIASNRLNRYELLMKINQDFWKRWSSEYVVQLQERKKWKLEKANENVQVGSMVLLRDITPPLQWRLGRITKVHPGRDGHIRTVTVKTQSGEVQRTLPKICILPINSF